MNTLSFLIALILLIVSWQLSDNGYQWASGFVCAAALWFATFIQRNDDDDSDSDEDDSDDWAYPPGGA